MAGQQGQQGRARGSVRGAVAERPGNGDVQGGGGDGRRIDRTEQQAIDDEVRGARGYLARIVPAHVNVDQYVAIVIGMLHRDERLSEAAMRNPPSLLAALADCARLGLMPGEGYALTGFRNSKAPGGMEVVGMVEYTGEIELMYRTGEVGAVICEVVFENDTYVREFEHEPPIFTPAGGRFSNYAKPRHAMSTAEIAAQDRGDGAETTRGAPIGAFAYVRFKDGGISKVVEMGADEIMTHRAAAKTQTFWDGPWWPSMWRKTPIHELEKWTPRSAEYVGRMMAAHAAVAEAGPPGAVAQLPASSPAPAVNGGGAAAIEAPDGSIAGNVVGPGAGAPPAGEHPAGERRTGRGAAGKSEQDDRPAAAAAVNRIGSMLDDAGIAPDMGPRLAIVRALAGDWDISDDDTHPITRGQADAVCAELRAVLDEQTPQQPAAARIGVIVGAIESAKFGGEPGAS